MPCSGHSLTTCHGWDTVLWHVVVETQYYMSCGDTVIQHVLVRTQFYDIAWSGRSYTTCPGWGADLQYAMFGTQFNNMFWSGHSFTTCHGWDTVLRHVLVRTQFYDISGSGRSYSTCPGWDAVLRHTFVNYLIISSMNRMHIKSLNYSMSVIITYVYIINVFSVCFIFYFRNVSGWMKYNVDRLHRADTLIDWNIIHDFMRNQWWVITNRGGRLDFPLLYAIICLFNVDDFINDTNMLSFLDVTTSWRLANTHICFIYIL